MTATLNQPFILSDSLDTMQGMFHPWHELRDLWPDWQVRFAVLPEGIRGCTIVETQTIWLDKRLNQAERRSCLTHELGHATAGHLESDDWDEAQIDQAAARQLISLETLLHVLPWASNVGEAAEEMFVDVDTLWTRLDHLHPSETQAIRRAFAARDNEDGTP